MHPQSEQRNGLSFASHVTDSPLPPGPLSCALSSNSHYFQAGTRCAETKLWFTNMFNLREYCLSIPHGLPKRSMRLFVSAGRLAQTSTVPDLVVTRGAYVGGYSFFRYCSLRYTTVLHEPHLQFDVADIQLMSNLAWFWSPKSGGSEHQRVRFQHGH